MSANSCAAHSRHLHLVENARHQAFEHGRHRVSVHRVVDEGGRLAVTGAARAPDLVETKTVSVKGDITDERVKERLQCKATSKQRSGIITFEGRKAALSAL